METVKWDHEMVRPDEAHGYYVFTLVVVYLPWWSKLGIKKLGLFFQVKFDLEGQGQLPAPQKKKRKKRGSWPSYFAPLVQINWSWLEQAMSYHTDKLVIDEHVQTDTNGHTDAGNNNTPWQKLALGKNEFEGVDCKTLAISSWPQCVNRLRQNCQNFADGILNFISLFENCCILIPISLKFVPNGLINNKPALIQIMDWHRAGVKPLSKPMNMPSSPWRVDHDCITNHACLYSVAVLYDVGQWQLWDTHTVTHTVWHIMRNLSHPCWGRNRPRDIWWWGVQSCGNWRATAAVTVDSVDDIVCLVTILARGRPVIGQVLSLRGIWESRRGTDVEDGQGNLYVLLVPACGHNTARKGERKLNPLCGLFIKLG